MAEGRRGGDATPQTLRSTRRPGLHDALSDTWWAGYGVVWYPMQPYQELETDYLRQIARLLENLGVTSDGVAVTYELDLQDYQIAIEQTGFSDDSLAQIAEGLWSLGCVWFADRPTYWRYSEIQTRVMTEIQAGLRLTNGAGQLRPSFDADAQSLEEYAEALEEWCGYKAGTFLLPLPNGEVLVRQRIGGPLDQWQRALSSTMALYDFLGPKLRYEPFVG